MSSIQHNPGQIRVAHVALQLQTGGMENVLLEFARHCDPTRYEPIFISLSSGGRVAQEIEACGRRVILLEEPPGLRPGLVLRLSATLRRLGVDIVHTHNTKPLLYGAAAARLAGVPALVHTRHGQRRNASARQTLLFALAARSADRIVCVSNDSAELCAAEGICSTNIRIIRNGIDTSRFPFVGPKADAPLVSIGRLSPEKDIATLLRAIAIVLPSLPSLHVQIAGGGPCLAELQRLTLDLRLERRVKFVGETNDVAGVLGHASLFVLPSLSEGISLTLLEAMASGLPVVATDVGGTREVVVGGKTGLLVPPGDPTALAEAILDLQRNPARGGEMGREGRARVGSRFDIDEMLRQYDLLYREVLQMRDGAALCA